MMAYTTPRVLRQVAGYLRLYQAYIIIMAIDDDKRASFVWWKVLYTSIY